MEALAQPGESIVGREAELARLRELVDRGAGAVLLSGDPGFGKTTLWQAGVAEARRRGLRVLPARPSGAEAELAFTGLIDLFDGVSDDELSALPAPQRRALAVALLRSDADRVHAQPRAVAVGLLSALRLLGARSPLLVAVDDAQWLDAASADALAFAARRLHDEPVAFLVAARARSLPRLEHALLTGQVERIAVGPLPLGALRTILARQLGLTVTRHVLRRIADATLGNPLFALEVGRALVEGGEVDLDGDIPVPGGVDAMLGTRVAALEPPLRTLLLACSLGGELRAGQLAAVAGGDALARALEAGVVVADRERVRASHPLLAAAAKTQARSDERRGVHLALAETTSEPDLRALHLALATDAPEAALAATVAAAAARADARGARHEAVLLAEHALRLTPADDAERPERVLALAAYRVVAGGNEAATELLHAELEGLPRGAARVRAHLLLAEGPVAGNAEIEDLFARALDESDGDPALRAHVLAEMATNTAVIRVERLHEAERWAREALDAAPHARPEIERLALFALAWVRSLRGRSVDDVVERFRAVSAAAFSGAVSPQRIAGQRLVWRGAITEARPLLTQLLSLADERGEPASYSVHRLHLCELELRTGGWDAAERLLEEWAESSDRMLWPMYERCRALLAAGRGVAEETERWAREAAESAETTGVRWDFLESERARATALLLAHEPARAADALRAVWEHCVSEGIDEPGVFPVAPDLVEGLVELGEVGEAAEVTERLRRLAEEHDHPWAGAGAARSAGLLVLADRWDDGAAARVEGAAAEYGALGLRFDRARSLLALGRAERRLKQWRAAARTLESAANAFDELGSPGWADSARAELERVGSRRRRSAEDALTASERRVAELAAQGRSNKEIARSLFVTPHTVEVHLSHAYAKLGIHSRAQLASRLAAKP